MRSYSSLPLKASDKVSFYYLHFCCGHAQRFKGMAKVSISLTKKLNHLSVFADNLYYVQNILAFWVVVRITNGW